MSVTEGDRRQIFTKLEEFVGEDVANNIMRLLPYQPHEELATRADLAGLTSMLRGEMAELRADLRNEMGELRAELRSEMGELRSDLQGEMAELRSDLQGEMGVLRSDLQGEMAELSTDLRGDFASHSASLQRWGIGLVSANLMAVMAALAGPAFL